MSEANRVSLKYLPEVTYGVTPANDPGWQALRFTSQNIAANPQTVISNELRSDRQVGDLVLVGSQVGGDIGFEFSDTTFDDLLEAVMQNTWATNVLTVGIAAPSYSVEVGFEDWTPAQFLQYNGMRVAGMSLNVAYGAIITGSFRMVGKTALQSTTSLVGTGSTAAAPTTEVMNGSAGVTNVKIDNAVVPGLIVKSITVNIDNSMRPVEGVGTVGPSGQSSGRAMITGTIEAYFDSITMYQKLLSNEATELDFTIGDGTNTYAFNFPRVKFNSGVPAVTGVDTDVMLPMAFTALFDGTDSELKITRAP